jgi:parallel beta-helix repeat protein
MRRTLAALAASLALPLPTLAADLHLSPTGSDDAGDGSLARPYRTLRYVLDPVNDKVRAGDRLLLRGPAGNNVYRENEVRLRVPLTVQSYDGEWAVIECPIDVADSVCVQVDPRASGSRLARVEITGGNLYGIFFQTDFDDRNNRSGTGASDVVVEDCRIHDTGRDAIKITPQSRNITIRRCEIWNTGRIYPAGTSTDDMNAEGIDNVNGSGMRVQDSYIHDTATSGLYFKGGAEDVLVERNRIERTGVGGIMFGFDTSPEFFNTERNPNYYEAVRGVVRNNVIRDTGYAGIGLYAAQNPIVANNTLVNTGQRGHAGIYFGVTLQDFEPQAKRPPTVSPTIVNNLIVQQGGQCANIRFANELGGLSALSGTTGMDYNLFHSQRGDCVFVDQRGDRLPEGGNLVRWRSLLTSDLNSLEVAVSVDATGRIAAGNPAIDRGVPVREVTDDIDRRPRSGAPDIGADELGGGPACGLWDLFADCDGDGMPNMVEQIFGDDPDAKDNDVFAESTVGRKRFVMQQFRDFLGREGDVGGVEFWLGEINAGRQTRAAMAEAFFNSPEFQNTAAPIARLYFATYGRIPDTAGLLFWIAEAKRGVSLAAIGQSFASAAEFVSRYGNLSNRDYIDQLYRNVLGRPADQGGIDFWTSQLNAGVTRGVMLAQFSESPEYRARVASQVYVTAIYVALLRRAPDMSGFDFWRQQIDGGRSGRDLITLFLAAAEYRGRFLPGPT